MKNYTLSFLLLFLSTITNGQEKYWAKLPVHGGVESIDVSPKEELWIATRAGSTYYTKEFGELWHFGPFGSKSDYFNSNGTFERVSFFSQDTMMISGYINGEDSNTDFVYWSGDGGKSWKQVKFGVGSWIDAVHVGKNGKAWMSGSSQYIYYTKDYGQTWEQKPKVEQTGNLRFNSIHFSKDENVGLFGSHWDVIYKTEDNCKTWQKLPTPLSQKKYNRLSKHDRPDIRKIRILGNYYVVNQQGRTFYTASDNINWQPLPNLTDFEVTENGSIYFIRKDLTVELLNSNLETIWKSSKRLVKSPTAITVTNGSLYTYSSGHIYKVNKDSLLHSVTMTDEVAIDEPNLKIDYKGEQVGFDNDEVLRYDRSKKQWYRVTDLPFTIGNATMHNDRLIFSDALLEHYYTIDIKNGKYNSYELPKSLLNVEHNKIKSFKIEQGSQGCFHNDTHIKEYKLKGDQFILTIDKTGHANHFLASMPSKIDVRLINEIANEVDASRYKQVSIASLNISVKDIKAFKAFIDEQERKIKKNGIDRFNFDNPYFFPGENIDFQFYKAVADSLYSIPNSVVNQIFSKPYGNWSTTTDWQKFTFQFQDGTSLILTNTDDKPNYMYAPWIVDYNGLKFKSTSLDLGHLLNKLTEGKLLKEVSQDTKYALFQIADYLYRTSVE